MGLTTEQEMTFDMNNEEKVFKNEDKVMLFRHSDLDGVGTEIVTRLFFNDVYAQQCEYSNVNSIIKAFIEGGEYIHYDHVIVADISFDREIAETISNNENLRSRFMVVDHHKTALWLNNYTFSIVEVERNGVLASGTSSLFEILYNYEIPFVDKNINIDSVRCFVEKVRRYDTWEWHKVYSDLEAKKLNDLFFKTANSFIPNMIEKLTLPIQRFMEGEWQDIFSNNERYMLTVSEREAESYINKKIKGVKYGIFNDMVYAYVLAESHISELGNQMCERLDIEFAVIIDVSRNKVSLRSKSETICDVSEIAKAVGGGGHACASGFQINLDWNRLVEIVLKGEVKHSNKNSLMQKFKNLIDKFVK